ncbi:hypothetical protein RZS08_47875, partial [Arthrospira platensis SPKY1]|nr:hypothetical protein [Arthrospira platensis SPKY1]
MIAGKDAAKPGEAKNSWLTGTAAWNFYAITRYILGVRPDYHHLIIDPCIPCSLKVLNIKRKWRNITYHIRIENPEGVSKGVVTIVADGKKYAGNQ